MTPTTTPKRWFTTGASITFVKHDDAYFKAFLYSFPFFLPVVFAVCNAAIFSWQYSVFGRYRRRALPEALPLRTIGKSTWESFNSFAIVGRWSMGSAVWLLYEDGIGIKTMVGKVFIPLNEIDALDLDRGSDMPHLHSSTSTLFHHSPEIRGPIIVPDWMAEIIAAQYPEKILRADGT